MVPDPSIMLVPIPFIDVETGCDVVYMMANYFSGRQSVGKVVAPRVLVREGTRHQSLKDDYLSVGDDATWV